MSMNDYSKLQIGVLGLQGDYERHEHQIALIGAKPVRVRLPGQLGSVDALIIPGGESTTMNILLDRFELRTPLLEFGRSKPVYGTCAGMIMLAAHIEDNQAGVQTLALVDIDVVRNGYGRQIFSFEDDLRVTLNSHEQSLRATFIRAPRVTRVGPEVRVIARYREDPVLVSQKNVLAGSFHTELDDDTTLLQYFCEHFLVNRCCP